MYEMMVDWVVGVWVGLGKVSFVLFLLFNLQQERAEMSSKTFWF